MTCCIKCTKAYIKNFDGYIMVKIFSKYRYLYTTKEQTIDMDNLTLIYSLNKLELAIALEVLNRFYNVILDKEDKCIIISKKQ